MTQKILEAAAKACGLSVKPMEIKNVTAQGDHRFIGLLADGWPRGWFNPLTNGLDTAAMCAKLAIGTDWLSTMSGELHGVACTTEDRGNYAAYFKDHNNDRETAWRYAACKVAEAIGKAMK